MARNPNDLHESRLNIHEKFALLLSDLLGSPFMIYIFLILSLIPIPQVYASHNLLTWTTWLTQTCIQLVALSILQAAAKILGKHAEIKADEDHRNAVLIEKNTERILALLEPKKRKPKK